MRIAHDRKASYIASPAKPRLEALIIPGTHCNLKALGAKLIDTGSCKIQLGQHQVVTIRMADKPHSS
jgi:hypothetical protein